MGRRKGVSGPTGNETGSRMTRGKQHNWKTGRKQSGKGRLASSKPEQKKTLLDYGNSADLVFLLT